MNLNISLSRVRRGARDVRQSNGFTLMELLIVIAIILILMLMAIPTIGSLKKKANETSAINSVQVISKAELQYESTYPSNGYACTLTALGGDPSAGAPSMAAAQILQGDLTSGFKSGYIFTLSCKDKVTVNGTDRFNSYSIVAIPQTVGKTGDRGFCSDQFGAITFDPAGGTNCAQSLGQ
jgi:type IV pilus assembly protein PilA